MSFRRCCGFGSRAFEIVRRSWLQTDGLPFANVLTAEDMQAEFEVEGVSFSERGSNRDDGLVYTPAITLWALLSQMLFTGAQRSCRSAVIRVAVYCSLCGRRISHTNTGAYCRARAKIPHTVIQRLTQRVARGCEDAVPDEWRWHGRTVRVADGTTCSLADTPENQAAYPQSKAQQPGIGFPILRVVALLSLTTGMVTAAACGPYAGKETGETALLRELFDEFAPGDVFLGDRYYCGWFMLALLRERGVDFVVRLHHLRRIDFRTGLRLGAGDHKVLWRKPPRPEWLDQQTYDRLPAELVIREVRVNTDIPGFRCRSLVIATSLGDPIEFPQADLAALYRRRWDAELRLREIKSLMELDVLRCKTPDMVHQELWAGFLAYNLIRQSMLQSAQAHDARPEHLSFTATMQFLANTWLAAVVTPPPPTDTPDPLILLRLTQGHAHRVGNRPNRIEPRAIKRRPMPHDLLTIPRAQARAKCFARRAT
jgi:putative transposase